jgi:hypothetical protein
MLKLFASFAHPLTRTPNFLAVVVAFHSDSWKFAVLMRIAMEAIRF